VNWRSLGLDPSSPFWNHAAGGVVPVDDPSVFAFSATSGVLAGPTPPLDAAPAAALRATPGLPQPLRLEVSFTPRRDAVYQSRFRLAVRAGESFEIVVVGRGTYAEEAP
jgi:hypothetical protein